MNGRCRLCGEDFFAEPQIRLSNLPVAAQHLPMAGDLSSDHGMKLEIAECSGCGVVQYTGNPVPYYRDVIRAAGCSPEMAKFRKRQFADWLERYGLRGGKILEAGCGRGEYLKLMCECGARGFGLEHGLEAAKFCRTSGLDVEPLYFETGTERPAAAPFDGFFILNYLEHLPDLTAYLRGVRNSLRPGAAGLIEVPNFDMIRRNGLVTEFCTEHLYYFTRETLTRTLENRGFVVDDCRTVWGDYILSAEVRLRAPSAVEMFSGTLKRLRADVFSFLSGQARTAVWGAGHQAMAVMALLELTPENIAYVVDSSPDKQGRYTFATHLPVVPPERLKSDAPDAVLVMCAAYSDEVVRLIRAGFGDKFKLAVMRDTGLEVLS